MCSAPPIMSARPPCAPTALAARSALIGIDRHSFVHFFSLHPSGSLLAACLHDGSVDVFCKRETLTHGTQMQSGTMLNAGEGAPIWDLGCTLTDHVGPVFRCSWDLTQSVPVLATVGADRGIQVYHFQRVVTKDRKMLLQASRWPITRGHEKDVITDIASIPPGQSQMMLLSTTSLDGKVRLYEVKANAPLERVAVWCPDPLTEDERSLSGVQQLGGVSCLSWFPGRFETCMTIAVGCISGRLAVASCAKDFDRIPLHPEPCCTSPVLDLEWAPAVGRRFNLLAVCSRNEIFIIRFNVISLSDLRPEENGSHPVKVEVFSTNFGACSVSWSRSATVLFFASDSVSSECSAHCIAMGDPTNHQSWEVR